MDCPRCGAAMQEETLERHHGRAVTIDLCQACQSFWFDTHESLQLTPGATLTLFRVIGERVARPSPKLSAEAGDTARCPRC